MTELFIKYLKGHVGDIYVWGAQGETNITEKWIRRREKRRTRHSPVGKA